MAELGYTKIEVYDLTMAEILSLRTAVTMRHSRQWEMHRFNAYVVAASNPYRKGKLPALHNFLPLLSDSELFEDEVNERGERHALMGSMYKQYSERWKN